MDDEEKAKLVKEIKREIEDWFNGPLRESEEEWFKNKVSNLLFLLCLTLDDLKYTRGKKEQFLRRLAENTEQVEKEFREFGGRIRSGNLQEPGQKGQG